MTTSTDITSYQERIIDGKKKIDIQHKHSCGMKFNHILYVDEQKYETYTPYSKEPADYGKLKKFEGENDHYMLISDKHAKANGFPKTFDVKVDKDNNRFDITDMDTVVADNAEKVL
jgi:hypothetical protein